MLQIAHWVNNMMIKVSKILIVKLLFYRFNLMMKMFQEIFTKEF